MSLMCMQIKHHGVSDILLIFSNLYSTPHNTVLSMPVVSGRLAVEFCSGFCEISVSMVTTITCQEPIMDFFSLPLDLAYIPRQSEFWTPCPEVSALNSGVQENTTMLQYTWTGNIMRCFMNKQTLKGNYCENKFYEHHQ